MISESKIEEIRRALAANRDVVLTAPPGSGKTTRVPPALLDEPWLAGRKIVMLEPRRLAARNCAAYIARQRNEALGETVGYQVRLERKVSARTRLEIVTEGLLAQRLLADPELTDVGLVIFDEFHERSLACDIAFALALEVRRALRPDLRLLVMSATLDANEVLAHLSEGAEKSPALVEAEGRMFPVETKYLGDVPLAVAIERALTETTGDVLCFLPGEGEIRRNLKPGYLPLYGALPKEEQDRVFAPSDRRKVILSTSIAETSVTIEGVTAVVDSGLMRVPRFSPGTGMTGLVTLPLTQDRAEQRRGRAGRVQAGVCYRLWTEAGEASRPKKAMPEILDADLSSLVLTCAAWGALKRTDLPWMTPPPASVWDQAVGLLKMLGALDDRGAMTPKGTRMAKLPMHPRLANMMLSVSSNDAPRAAELAAILEEGSRARETDLRYVQKNDRIHQLARRFLNVASWGQTTDFWGQTTDFSLSEGALLSRAYPDRIAKNRGHATFRMVSGRGAFLDPSDPLAAEPYLVCCQLDDRMGDAKIFRAAPILAEEIEALFGDQIVDEPFCQWDASTERVKGGLRRRLGSLALDERPCRPDGMEAQVTTALMDGIRQKGVGNLPCWTKESLQMKARVQFLRANLPDAASPWPELSDGQFLAALSGFVGGLTKWKDLEKVDLFAVMDFILSECGHNRRELDRLAPTKMEVPSGSHMTIHYEGAEPTVSVRLQECFGLMETPKVAGGRVPIVMTLLSPAQRPIQITKDLAGFWRGAYQLVRKDMRGRYPKHNWPEDPFTAVASRRTTVSRPDQHR